MREQLVTALQAWNLAKESDDELFFIAAGQQMAAAIENLLMDDAIRGYLEKKRGASESRVWSGLQQGSSSWTTP